MSSRSSSRSPLESELVPLGFRLRMLSIVNLREALGRHGAAALLIFSQTLGAFRAFFLVTAATDAPYQQLPLLSRHCLPPRVLLRLHNRSRSASPLLIGSAQRSVCANGGEGGRRTGRPPPLLLPSFVTLLLLVHPQQRCLQPSRAPPVTYSALMLRNMRLFFVSAARAALLSKLKKYILFS